MNLYALTRPRRKRSGPPRRGRDALLWNAVKYIARCYRKGNTLEDLKKAAWYLQRRITAMEHQSPGNDEKPAKSHQGRGRQTQSKLV